MHAFSMKKTLRVLICASAIGLCLPLAEPTVWTADALAQTRVQQQRAGQPQNFFEALFPKLIEQRLERQRQIQAIEEPVVVQKVSAPRYYDYTPVKLVRIDLSGLMPAEAQGEDDTAPDADGEVKAEPAALRYVPRDEDGIDAANEAVESAPAGEPEEREAVTLPPDPPQENYALISRRFADLAVMAEPEIADLIVEHYGTEKRTLWLNRDLQPSARARTVLALFETAGEYGLNPADYEVQLPSQSPTQGGREESAARFEIEMTARAIRYGRDASVGRVNPNKLSGYHDLPIPAGIARTVLDKLSSDALPAPQLAAMHPSNEAFETLRKELAEIEHGASDLIVIPANTLVKPGETHEQVPNILAAIAKRGSAELAEKAQALLDASEKPASFTPEVVEVVKAFQKEQDLGVDGVVGPNTVSKLTDVDPATKKARVKLAMERLRWLPHDLGRRHVFINQPEYIARYMVDGELKLGTRIVVGTRANQTSFFRDEIETVEYNPYWGVPRSIIVNEMLPKLRANPAYLDERNYEVTDRKGRRVSSASIDWNRVGGNVGYDVRQRPGRNNALGALKILFPNKHAIYMHDTPEKHLFERSVRAYSHGCIRLQRPREMAAALLGKDEAYVDSKIAGGHSAEGVGGNIPVYVSYFTAWPDESGKVNYFADVYGRDERLTKALEATIVSRGPTT